MAQKFVGVDIGSHHIKVAVVSSGIRGVQVLDAFEEPVGAPEPADAEPSTAQGDGAAAAIDPLAQSLSVALGALRSRGLLAEPLAICLPPSLLSYRVLSFPFSDERRIAQAVGFEAEGQFPVPLDQLAHGHAVVPAQDGGGRALLVAARRDRMDQIVSIFRRAGADIKSVTSGPVAAAQVLHPELPGASAELADKGLTPVALFVDFGHQFTHFVALGAKGPLAVRTLRRGGRNITDALARAYDLVDPGQAEANKHSDAFLPHHGFNDITPEQMEAGKVVAKILEPVLREIEHTRLWLRATYRLEAVKLVLGGGGAALNGLREYLTEQTGLPVETAHPKSGGLKNVAGRDWSSTVAALGAAYGAARRPLIQLHDATASDTGGSWLQERMSGLVALGVAVLAFGALDTISRVKAGEAELAAYEHELETATTKYFGRAASAQEVGELLALVDGEDLMSVLPERSALDVMADIVAAATPTDLGEQPPPMALLPGESPPGSAEPGVTPTEADELAAQDSEGAAAGPVETSAGIVVADDLVISLLEIRERRIEIKATANSSPAQDRLVYKLSQITCLSNFEKGKSKGDERKTFMPTMDHNCYKSKPDTGDEEASG